MNYDSKILDNAHKAILEELRAAVDIVLDQAATDTKAAVAKDKSFKDVSGKLRKSIRSRRSKRGLTVFSLVKYAGYVEHGTAGPYQIRARRRRFLKFKVNGEWTFRKSVTHPGIKARKFLFRASQEAFSKVGNNLWDLLK